jgi:hypothetical protein
MALETATAVQTPLPLPDMSSPSSNLVYFSFISSISEQKKQSHRHQQTPQSTGHPDQVSKHRPSPSSVTFVLHGLLVQGLLHLLHAQLAAHRRLGRRTAQTVAAAPRRRHVKLLLVGKGGHAEHRPRVVAAVAMAVEAREPGTVVAHRRCPCCFRSVDACLRQRTAREMR